MYTAGLRKLGEPRRIEDGLGGDVVGTVGLRRDCQAIRLCDVVRMNCLKTKTGYARYERCQAGS